MQALQKAFNQLNQHYDKIFVLSVQAAAERRELFAERFAGLDYTFFYGADKNNFNIENLVEKNIYNEDLAKKNHRYNKLMMPGEIACAWSHRMMYEEMLKNDYSRVLILEDDAVPDTEVMQHLPEILSEIPTECELLMWGWSKNGKSNTKTFFKQKSYHLQHMFGVLKWDHTVIKNLFAKKFSKHLKKAGFHDYTYAYGITKAGAEKLLKMQTPLQYIADNLLAYAITAKVISGFIVYPAAMLHDNLPDGTARDSYIR